jgi:flagellar hook-associated protein 2
MLDTINSDTAANATMVYNRLTDGFTIISNTDVSIKNISGNAFGTASAFGIAEQAMKAGSDSEAVINGTIVTRDSNSYTIDDISYDLKKVTKDTAEPVVNFSLERDYSSMINNVSKFIDGYNTLYTKLKTLVNETDNSYDYPPLTDAQKDEMSDEQITAWEKKAKVGLLRQNADLTNLMSNLKNSFFSALGGTGKTSTEIGFSAAGFFDSNSGQITLDEDKLSEALKNNAEEVIGMFTNGSSTAASSEQGLIYKIKSSITKYSSTAASSMKTIKTQISSYDTQIDGLEDKLSSLADRYYAKFSSMETALSKLNSQSSYISQMFA